MRKFANFSELYRAAYAETDHELKLALLGEVKRAIEEWQRTARQPAAHTAIIAPPAGSTVLRAPGHAA